jgi:hypothetical protein
MIKNTGNAVMRGPKWWYCDSNIAETCDIIVLTDRNGRLNPTYPVNNIATTNRIADVSAFLMANPNNRPSANSNPMFNRLLNSIVILIIPRQAFLN